MLICNRLRKAHASVQYRRTTDGMPDFDNIARGIGPTVCPRLLLSRAGHARKGGALPLPVFASYVLILSPAKTGGQTKNRRSGGRHGLFRQDCTRQRERAVSSPALTWEDRARPQGSQLRTRASRAKGQPVPAHALARRQGRRRSRVGARPHGSAGSYGISLMATFV
jgi:hypothetical protein